MLTARTRISTAIAVAMLTGCGSIDSTVAPDVKPAVIDAPDAQDVAALRAQLVVLRAEAVRDATTHPHKIAWTSGGVRHSTDAVGYFDRAINGLNDAGAPTSSASGPERLTGFGSAAYLTIWGGTAVIGGPSYGQVSITTSTSVTQTSSTIRQLSQVTTVMVPNASPHNISVTGNFGQSSLVKIIPVLLPSGGCVQASSTHHGINTQNATADAFGSDAYCVPSAPQGPCGSNEIISDTPGSPTDTVDDPTCDNGDGSGGSGVGTNCHTEYIYIEVNDGSGWQIWWEGYATVCE
jgi:hypothetical protein